MQVRQVGTMVGKRTMGNLLRKGFPIPLQTFLKNGMVQTKRGIPKYTSFGAGVILL